MSIVSEIIGVGGYKITDAYLTPDQWVRPQIRIKPTDFILHWSGNINYGADDIANRNYMENLVNNYASSQTFCDNNSILALIPFMPYNAEQAYHVGANVYYNKFKNNGYPNSYTLGHEMSVNKDGDFRETYKRSVWLMTYWCYLYDKNPFENLWRHKDVTNKQCPYMMIDDVLDYNKTYAIVSSMYTSTTDLVRKQQLIDEGVKFIMEELHIDGIQGEALWDKFKNDVDELLVNMKANNGELKDTEEDEDNMALQINDYEWQMQNAIWSQRFNDDEITDFKWVAKIRNKTLTAGELAFLNSVIAAKKDGISVEANSYGMEV